MTRDGGRGARTGEEAGEGSEQPVTHRRSTAEWTTLAVSIALILGLVGLVTYLYISGDNRPPIVEAIPLIEEVRQEGNAYYVPIEVTNRGDQTAEEVQVQAALSNPEGQQETAQFTIPFLAGGETTTGTAVFSEDPSAGELTVGAVSYRRP